MTNSPSDERAADQAAETTTGPPGGEDDALTEELERVRAQYARAIADYQNLQRRSQQDRLDSSRQVLSTLVRNFLPVLDDLNRALDSVDADLAEHRWVDGVRLVRDKFRGVLESAGVSEIAAVGERFDPQVHEAVGHAPGAEGQVAHLVQAGYALGERVIRPAMVLVGNGETSDVVDAVTDDAAGMARGSDDAER
jgi:molecular chaperone GrpE